MAHFLWVGGGGGDIHKYHLVNWGLVSQKKDFGGLGIPNLREFNLSLLASWVSRFFQSLDKDCSCWLIPELPSLMCYGSSKMWVPPF